MGIRNLPDERLHDLLHKLAEARKAEDEIYTRIYEHIELNVLHEETIKKMIKNKGDKDERYTGVSKKECCRDC